MGQEGASNDLTASAAVHYGRFLTTEVRHGGTRRTQQLREILERRGARVINLPLASERRTSLGARAMGAARGIAVSPFSELRRVRRPAGLYHRAMADLALSAAPAALPVVWEGGPGEAFYGGWAAHRNGHRVVAVPQNFDALTPGMASSWTGHRSPDWFEEELNELRHADAIFVLSSNDRWLLSLYGLDSDVLPYHPPADVEEGLLELRRERSARSQPTAVVLALGTLGSEPTARGFHELYRMLTTPETRSTARSLVVAGFGTEQLRSDFERVGARVLGSLSEADLRSQQLDARALLVHYVPTPGALTRIPEALIAGIPVIANRHAARGYESLAGIHVYDGPDELVQLVATDLPMPPIPPRPTAETRFAASVLRQ